MEQAIKYSPFPNEFPVPKTSRLGHTRCNTP